VLLRQGQSEAAEELYRRALSITEEQEAKLLRAAVSLDPPRPGPAHGTGNPSQHPLVERQP